MRNRFWKELKGIEVTIILLITFIVIGVVALRYPDFKCRSMQSEAKFSLQEIYAAQRYFYSEHNHYATLNRLMNKDSRVKILQKYYIFSDNTLPTKDNFSIMAKGIDGTLVANEIWTVNELKDINIIKSACKK